MRLPRCTIVPPLTVQFFDHECGLVLSNNSSRSRAQGSPTPQSERRVLYTKIVGFSLRLECNRVSVLLFEVVTSESECSNFQAPSHLNGATTEFPVTMALSPERRWRNLLHLYCCLTIPTHCCCFHVVFRPQNCGAHSKCTIDSSSDPAS